MHTVDIYRPSYEILKYITNQQRVACYVWAKKEQQHAEGPIILGGKKGGGDIAAFFPIPDD